MPRRLTIVISSVLLLSSALMAVDYTLSPHASATWLILFGGVLFLSSVVLLLFIEINKNNLKK